MNGKCPIDHSKYTGPNPHLPANSTVGEEIGHAVLAAKKHQQDQESQKCPVIHAVNDAEVQQVSATENVSAGPFMKQQGNYSAQQSTSSENPMTEKASAFDFEEEFDDEIPSMRQYKKLKRTTVLITNFYRNGTVMKGENYEASLEDLKRLEEDEKMAKEQLNSLLGKEHYKGHLKFKEMTGDLEEELSRLEAQKQEILKHAEKCKNLHEWSKGIVKICEWLELNLDNYCKRYLDLPKHILADLQPVPELSKETAEEYSKGLDEIMHNLNESRDFFQAAVDGRLDQYHNVEKQMILDQMDVIRQYPEGNPRRDYILDQLEQDLAHIESELVKAQQQPTIKRRQKMLDLHLDFLRVLNFFKSKLKLLNDGDIANREFDATFSQTFVLSSQ